MSISSSYSQFIQQNLQEVLKTQEEPLNQAATLAAKSIKAGGRIYVFGTGHSHMIAEEIYNRAGGLALVNAILEPSLMIHEQPNKSTYVERLSGYAEILFRLSGISAKDIIMIVSTSGRNALTVEMGLKARETGTKLIAMTSLPSSQQLSSRHPSGKRLFELADVVLDTMTKYGDAGFQVPNLENPVGPTSSLAGVALAQTFIVTVIDQLVQMGIKPPVFRSSNVDGADEYNDKLFQEYASW